MRSPLSFRVAAVTIPLLALAACGRGTPQATAPTPTATGANPATGGSDFGHVKSVCGPGSGVAPTSSARGVSSSEIHIGVVNDATGPVPGLGAVYVDVAKAFAQWCNAAGGINGRKIVITSRDGKFVEAAARVVDACQQDFMLVGGGTPLDAGTVSARAACGMAAIPAYVASTENRKSPRQALPTRAGNTQVNVFALRALAAQFGGAFKQTGVIAIDNPSLLSVSDPLRKALPQVGATEVSYQKLPNTVTNFRTYVQPLKGKTQALIAPLAPSAGIFQAMSDVGYQPQVILDPLGYTYAQSLIDALKSAPVRSPYYVSVSVFPLEIADQNPTLKKALELTRALQSKVPIDANIIPAWSAWLLFAQSATACSQELSSDCVINKATAEKAWTAGAMQPPTDLSDVEVTSPCRLLMSATPKGFNYERGLTKPTDGPFNCDPENVVKTDS